MTLSRSEINTLRSLRLLWFTQAMVLIVLVFLIAVFFIPYSPAFGYSFFLFGGLGFVCLSVAIFTLFFLRNQIYKANWFEDRVTAAGYGKANYTLILYAGLTPMFLIVETVLSGGSWVCLGGIILGLIIFITNYPTGKPMLPAAVRLGKAWP